jgi:hypothetical protein
LLAHVPDAEVLSAEHPPCEGQMIDCCATWAYHSATKFVAVPDAQGGERPMMGTAPDVQAPIWEEG